MKFLEQAIKFHAMSNYPFLRRQVREQAELEKLINKIMILAGQQNKSSIDPITKEKIILHAMSIAKEKPCTLKQILQEILWDAKEGVLLNFYVNNRGNNRREIKKMKKSLSIITIIFLFCSISYARSMPRYEKVGEFVCNVILDGNPIKEIDGVAVIPFDSEYKIILKNKNDRKAAAKVTIDGSPISSFGDLVINANSEVILERFITESLTEGKRFKFVPLNNPEVDDPGRAENGLIKVEFRLEKKREYIQPVGIQGYFWYHDDIVLDFSDLATTTIDVSNIDNNNVNCSATSTEPGATIGGSVSNQTFKKVDIEFEDKTWTIEILLKGIRK